MAWVVLDALGNTTLRDDMPNSDMLEPGIDRVIRALPDARVGIHLLPIQYGSVGSDPLHFGAARSDQLHAFTESMARDFFVAVRRGQVVNLGSAAIADLERAKVIGKDLLDSQAVRHPFTSPWLLCVSVEWSDGVRTPLTVLVRPDPGIEGGFQFVGLSLSKGDIFRLTPQKIGHYDPTSGSLMPLLDTLAQERDEVHQVVGLFGATVLASLAVLNTRGVAWSSWQRVVSPKGKITKVGTHRLASPYFTVLGDRRRASERVAGNGELPTHASRRPHVRRGHVRHLASGETTWVRDCLVNVASEDEVAFFERIAYKVKPPLPGTKPAGVVPLSGRTPAPADGDKQ